MSLANRGIYIIIVIKFKRRSGENVDLLQKSYKEQRPYMNVTLADVVLIVSEISQ